MARIWSKITYHTKNQEHVTTFKGKSNQHMQPARWPSCGNYQTKIFKAPLIIMIHEVRVNTVEMSGKAGIFSQEIESIPKKQMEIFEPIGNNTN